MYLGVSGEIRQWLLRYIADAVRELESRHSRDLYQIKWVARKIASGEISYFCDDATKYDSDDKGGEYEVVGIQVIQLGLRIYFPLFFAK